MLEVSGKVAVIVPMFNAEKTIAATLESIVRQTLQDLDIVVVDDGSSDRSPSLVLEAARRDPRIRLLRQANAGVAAARNAGAAATQADFLAFIDADDLWAPRKIERQLEVLTANQTTGVVYCWFAAICAEGRLYPKWPQPEHRGNVLRHLCQRNFVGNGSSLLVRRTAFEAAGGFDVTLRQRGAEGCEDWLICLRLAERHAFDVVPDFLVGYRQHADNMSNDGRKMLRSMQLVIDEYKRKFPQYAGELDANLEDFIGWMAERSASNGNWDLSVDLIAQLPTGRAALVKEGVERARHASAKRKVVPKSLRRFINALPMASRWRRPLYLESLAAESGTQHPIAQRARRQNKLSSSDCPGRD